MWLRAIFILGLAAFSGAMAAGLFEAFTVSGTLPMGSQAYQRRAYALSASGDLAGAIREFTGEHRVNWNPTGGSDALFSLLMQTGRTAEALDVLGEVAARSTNPTLQVRYSQHLAAAGRNTDAYTALLRATRLAPKDAGLQNRLGLFLEEHGEYERAARAYRTALSLDASLSEARVRLTSVSERIAKGAGSSIASEEAPGR